VLIGRGCIENRSKFDSNAFQGAGWNNAREAAAQMSVFSSGNSYNTLSTVQLNVNDGLIQISEDIFGGNFYQGLNFVPSSDSETRKQKLHQSASLHGSIYSSDDGRQVVQESASNELTFDSLIDGNDMLQMMDQDDDTLIRLGSDLISMGGDDNSFDSYLDYTGTNNCGSPLPPLDDFVFPSDYERSDHANGQLIRDHGEDLASLFHNYDVYEKENPEQAADFVYPRAANRCGDRKRSLTDERSTSPSMKKQRY